MIKGYEIEDFFDWNAERDFQNKLKSSIDFFERYNNFVKIETIEHFIDCFFDNSFIDGYYQYVEKNEQSNVIGLNKIILDKICFENKGLEFLEFIKENDKNDLIKNGILKKLNLDTQLKKDIIEYIKTKRQNKSKYLESYLEINESLNNILHLDINMNYEDFLKDLYKVHSSYMNYVIENINFLVNDEYIKKNKENIFKSLNNSLKKIDNNGVYFAKEDIENKLLNYFSDDELKTYIKNNVDFLIKDKNRQNKIPLISQTFRMFNILKDKDYSLFDDIFDKEIFSQNMDLISCLVKHNVLKDRIDKSIDEYINSKETINKDFISKIKDDFLFTQCINKIIEKNKEIEKIDFSYMNIYYTNIWIRQDIKYDLLKNERIAYDISKNAALNKSNKFFNLIYEKKCYILLEKLINLKNNRCDIVKLLNILQNTEIKDEIYKKIISENISNKKNMDILYSDEKIKNKILNLLTPEDKEILNKNKLKM